MRIFFLVVLFTSLLVSCDDIILENRVDSNQPHSTIKEERWIQVPANAGGMGLSSFYVMKYEAKAMLEVDESFDPTGDAVDKNTHKPVSTEANQPWRNVSANDSASECESLGPKYHLISNQEWMAIARDIEAQGSNWSSGSVGIDCLYRGNTGEATTLTSCGYNAGQPDAGANRDSRAKHVLSNGNEIFDISGNVWEWVDWNPVISGFQIGPTTCTAADLDSVNCPDLSDPDYNTSAGTYTSVNGVGHFFGGAGGSYGRGGSYTNGDAAGVYASGSFYQPTQIFQHAGFRCVFRP